MDEDGFAELSDVSMPFAFEQYEFGKRGSLWRDLEVVEAEQVFSDEICDIRQIFDGSAGELTTDWPGESFRDVTAAILLKSGVLHADADKTVNPYRRSKHELCDIGQYLSGLI